MIVPLQRQLMRHNVVLKGKTSPLLTRGNEMALNVQFYKIHNKMIDEDIVVPHLVSQQSLDFNDLCEYLADGSTVTAADVAAVMKLIELRLPLVLGLNAKVVCSPEGLTFRPKVSGSITQSELKAKLQARKEAETDPEKAAKINVDRELATSDLSISDLTASISIELPKKWHERFKSKVEFKRVAKDQNESTEGGEGSSNGSGTGGSNENQNENQNGNENQNQSVGAPVINGNTSFTESVQVTMTAESGAEIRYTTDGSTPTASSTLYSEAITLGDTTTVKAIAIKDGVSSSVSSKTFTKTSGDGEPDGDGGFNND